LDVVVYTGGAGTPDPYNRHKDPPQTCDRLASGPLINSSWHVLVIIMIIVIIISFLLFLLRFTKQVFISVVILKTYPHEVDKFLQRLVHMINQNL
jgi:hypothetical protein